MKDKALQKTLRRNYVRAEIAADEPHGADRRHRHAPAGGNAAGHRGFAAGGCGTGAPDRTAAFLAGAARYGEHPDRGGGHCSAAGHAAAACAAGVGRQHEPHLAGPGRDPAGKNGRLEDGRLVWLLLAEQAAAQAHHRRAGRCHLHRHQRCRERQWRGARRALCG